MASPVRQMGIQASEPGSDRAPGGRESRLQLQSLEGANVQARPWASKPSGDMVCREAGYREHGRGGSRGELSDMGATN